MKTLMGNLPASPKEMACGMKFLPFYCVQAPYLHIQHSFIHLCNSLPLFSLN